MAETSKNKIYYNDNENSIADVLTDMKKMAESTDEAIEKSKYNDTQIKKDISNMKTEIAAKNNEQDNEILQLQTEKAELEKELKEMQEDCYQTSIRGQASGEYIHVEDSSGARCKIGISGNSEQETSTQGRNLIIPQDYTATKNGITVTAKNGVINVKGTATQSTSFNVPINKISLNGDYYFSTKITGTVALNNCAIRLLNENGKNFVDEWCTFNPNTQPGFSGNMNGTTGYILIYLNPVTVDYYIYPQLEQGTQKHGYEQFVPNMPSPDYPSEIKTVGSNVNLFDKDTATDGKYIDNSGSIQAEATAMCSGYIEIENNKDYYISGRTNWGSIGIYDTSKTFLNRIATTQTNGIFNITNSNCKYIRVNASITDKDTLKIEKGSTPTSYSKYGQGSVKLTKCNKNLFDKSNWESGYVGEDGNNASSTTNFRLTKFIKVKPNTQYTISSNTVMKTLRLHEYNKDKTYIKFTYSTDKEKLTIVTSENTKYLRFSGNYNSPSSYTQSVIDGLGIILEEGNIRTSYEEHQEQSYIMPVQQEMLEDDYFDWDNEEEVHNWKKVVLTGDEGWERETTESYGYRFRLLPNPEAKFNNTKKNIFCNKLNRKTANETWLGNEGISASSKIHIYLKEYSTKTLDEFKIWLKEHMLTVYYKLAKPTRLAFTEEQKVVAKELSNTRTYKNVTNITTDSIAILDLDYAKDLETLLNNTQALAVNNASEGV